MIFDLHNDFPTELSVNDFADYIRFCDGVVTAAIWTSEFDKRSANARVAELEKSLTAINVPIAIEDIGFLFDGEMYRNTDFSRYFYCSLTWNDNNGFAGGALDDGTLTKAGQCAIQCMNGRCAVDLAHLNRKSFYEALDIAQNPMCSHTGFNSHLRSLDGMQIKALVDRNAPIGLSAVTKFTDAETATAFADVIDGFVQGYGIQQLCIGTDFNGSTDLPTDLRGYPDFYRIADRLSALGYQNTDIESIFYGNAMRFYEEIHHERHL
ncbi:MAG: membrane dipeptidase [Clostridiales bacterium]|nr:membrane dipeptidase [Clostridiales bacterium]